MKSQLGIWGRLEPPRLMGLEFQVGITIPRIVCGDKGATNPSQIPGKNWNYSQKKGQDFHSRGAVGVFLGISHNLRIWNIPDWNISWVSSFPRKIRQRNSKCKFQFLGRKFRGEFWGKSENSTKNFSRWPKKSQKIPMEKSRPELKGRNLTQE